MPLEDVIAAHLGQLFPGMEVVQHHTFRVTRNEDLEVDEDDAENLLHALEKRAAAPPVRPPGPARGRRRRSTRRCWSCCVRELGVTETEVYRLPAPLDLAACSRSLAWTGPS